MTIKYPCQTLVAEAERIEATVDFVERNRLRLNRSSEEIEQRLSQDSFFGFENEVLLPYLSWERAKKHYSPEFVLKVEQGKAQFNHRDDLLHGVQDFLDYMVFAWGKALDQRGLSASRSISKLGAWLWLFGREDLREMINLDALYNPYGAPALIAVCGELQIGVPQELVDFAKVKCEG